MCSAGYGKRDGMSHGKKNEVCSVYALEGRAGHDITYAHYIDMTMLGEDEREYAREYNDIAQQT